MDRAPRFWAFDRAHEGYNPLLLYQSPTYAYPSNPSNSRRMSEIPAPLVCNACTAHKEHSSYLLGPAPFEYPCDRHHRRSVSISGSLFKNGGTGSSGGASSPRSKARPNLVKRRSASLAGGAAAPPSSTELGLLPAATTNVDGFGIAVAGAAGSIEGFEVADGGPDHDGNSPDSWDSPPVLVSRRTD